MNRRKDAPKFVCIRMKLEEIMYKLIKRDGKAKRGEFHTVHGVIQTPVFMNVGTAAAIKGAVSTEDLQQIGTPSRKTG